jgi:UDP-N-acetylglucosamine 4,6-dehydratase
MSRFWITLEQAVRFTIGCIEQMHGGEIFVPKIPTMSLLEVAKTLAPDCEVEYMGIRPGEKLHEVLLSEDEARNTLDLPDMYVIQPSPHSWWRNDNWPDARTMPEGFRYASDTNPLRLTSDQLHALVEETGSSHSLKLVEMKSAGD